MPDARRSANRENSTAPRFVSYLRVSTAKQGITGLGIEAQREAVARLVRAATLLAEYVEVESGRRSDRPELAKALTHSRNAGATLVIAKLDRLSRNVHFLTGLQEAGVEFVACDLPDANRLTLTVMAAVAEHERDAISDRTKAALVAARKRVVKTGQRGHPNVKRLGNPHGAKHLRGKDNAPAIAAIKDRANATARRLRGELDALRLTGVTSARGIASALNARGVLSPRGRQWDAKGVTRLFARLSLM